MSGEKPAGSNNGTVYNKWNYVNDPNAIPTPQFITITAKYGADLRGVWPVARSEEFIEKEKTGVNRNFGAQLISWTATLGKYRDDSVTYGNSHFDEATIMGLFASMNEEVIAVPDNPDQVHHLVAYWEDNCASSYYRYTHCYEAPGLVIDPGDSGIKKISLYNNSADLKDTLYLVPKSNEAFAKYGFTDLLTVTYNESENKVEYSQYGQNNGGEYYAVRGYETTENGQKVTKYYAVGRQIDTVSTNNIQSQNPSARAHMSKVNNVADHTAQYKDSDGRTWDSSSKHVGTADNPYDLYFYYDRDRYTIRYMVPVNRSDRNETEQELGRIELPYGAHVTKEDYAFELDYKDTNQQKENGGHKYRWTYPAGGPVPVCPDRNENGRKAWTFKGWGLGPAGINMLWRSSAVSTRDNEPQAQVSDDFYIGSDLLLYAIWENPSCNVTFHLNGGTASTFSADSDETITVTVPANTKITEADAKIPRPFYAGHTMAGWYMADENGKILIPEEQFDFNAFITDDVHVAAKWTAETVKDYRYTIYFVTDDPANAGSIKGKVYIKDGQIVKKDTAGAEEYYVLGTEENKKKHIPGTTLNLKAKEFTGYIPKETNKSLTLNEISSEYDVIFYYDSYVRGSYIVRFVEAGTEQGADPAVVLQNVISEESVKADKAVLTPGAEAVKALRDKDYELVSKRSDGTYETVTDYEELTWLDSRGTLHPWSSDLTDLLKNDAKRTITYLVRPILYTITYKNAEGSPAAADAALSALTAENTPAESAKGKNPALYTAKDEFTLKNPAPVYDDATGKYYQFTHWSLGDNTTAKTDLRGEYPTLTVDKGTMGDVTFVANWKVLNNVGSLTVSKTVSGNRGDKQKKFTFTVTLGDPSIEGRYGDMDFHAGTASFELKHGESMTAHALPAGISYEVKESNNDGYKVTSTGETGTIEADKTAVAAFCNHRSKSSHSGGGDDSEEPSVGARPAAATAVISPKTGDDVNPALWLALIGASCVGIWAAFRRKKNQ